MRSGHPGDVAPFLGVVAAAGLIAAAAITVVQDPLLLRPLVAILLAGGLGLLGLWRPQAAIVLTFAFLALLGLVRRMLIPVAGWTSYDPLLLVAPVVSITLLASFMRRASANSRRDSLTVLVAALLGFTLLESFNSAGGSVLSGLVGLLFLGAPLLWFFIGRGFGDEADLRRLLVAVVTWATLIAVYGLSQTLIGLTSWDGAWITAGGYAALNVNGALRAFGTFASSEEYAAYLGVALVVAVALLLSGRRLAAVSIPVLAVALFIDSTRGIVLLVLVAILVMLGLRAKHRVRAAAATLAGVAGVGIVVWAAGPMLESRINGFSNPLITHQVGGLLHPFDPQQSTLLLHLQRFVDGVRYGLQNPLGLGTGSSNIAGIKLGAGALRTEADLSNAFVSLGLVGGLIFLLVVIASFRQVVTGCIVRRDSLLLAVLGALIVTLGQWLAGGGQYAIAPLVWFLVGWSSQQASGASHADRDLETAGPWFEHRSALQPAGAGGQDRS